MINSIKILLLSVFLTGLQACSTFQTDRAAEHGSIDKLLSSDFFESSQIGISVYDLTGNKQIYGRNGKLLLRPASNQKILTTGSALIFLGSNYKFRTSVYYSGEIKDSVCSGDIFLIGGLDPEFTAGDLDSLTASIKHFGIKRIEGNLFADISAMDSLFLGEGWSWDDDPASYQPYLTPLCVDKNCIRISYKPGETGKPAIINLIPETNFFPVINSSVTTDTGRTNLSITRDWINRNNSIIVKGNIGRYAPSDTVKLNVFNPTLYFLTLMKENMQRRGIDLMGRVDTASVKKESVRIYSFERNIKTVIDGANKRSDNLNAEMLLRAMPLLSGEKHSSAEKGKIFVDSLITLAGFKPDNYRIADGSGLSNYNLVSADLITGVLKYFFYEQPVLYEELFNSFSIAGTDGTLINRLKDPGLINNVRGKTGSLSGVSSLSGYLKSRNNHMIAFSILIQNFTGNSGYARSIQDEICKIIYTSN